MSCNDNISNTCADPILTTCVDHEGVLGKNTKTTKDCVTQYDVNEDLYSITDENAAKIDVSSIVGDCINIPDNSTIAEILELLKDKVCELETNVSDLQNINYANIDITEFGLNIPNCIADSCANPPATLAEWMQVMMDQRNCT